jgi:hypothetical protein
MTLEDYLTNVEITSQQLENALLLEQKLLRLTRKILHEDIFSIGSSGRATYVPNDYGLPQDIDYYIKDKRDLSDTITAVNEHKSAYEDILSTFYGCSVELQLMNAVKQVDESTGEVHYRQARYQAVNTATGEILLGLDLNYDESLRGDECYNAVFASQLETLVSRLPDADKELGRDYLLANIRALKLYLSQHKIYKTKEGGFGGIGCEQLLLQLHEGKTFANLDSLRQHYNMGMALKTLYEERDSLTICHPITREELLDAKLSRHHGEGWNKILLVAKDYEDYLPREHAYQHSSYVDLGLSLQAA